MMTSSPRQEMCAAAPQSAGWYRAMTLLERIQRCEESGMRPQLAEMVPSEQGRQLLARWNEQPPFHKADYFAQRLEQAGLTEQELLILLSAPDEMIQKCCPTDSAWVMELEHILTAYCHSAPLAAGVSQPATGQEQEGKRKTSFLAILQPFIARGTERLRAGIGELLANYPSAPFELEAIEQCLQGSLPPLLIYQAARTLTLELHVARMLGRLQGETSEERFQDFVNLMCTQENLHLLLEEYALLARQLLITLDNWVHYHLEFLQHLCQDWPEICRVMQPSEDPGLLVVVQSGIGDRHRKGRSTLRLRFTSGFHLVYKPKSMAIDIHFQRLLHWLNERGDHPAFRLLKVIDRGTYGWSEFIATQDCASQEEVARFYERQGGYLALLYALEGTDVHFENLIAAGEHPMMIDLESLFQPRMDLPEFLQAQRIAVETMDSSVLRVGLLPQRVWGDREQAGIDVSGLSGQEGQLTPRPVLQVEDIGTDQMRYIRERVRITGSENLPRVAGQAANVLDYRQHIITGFTKIYRFLMQHCDELLAGPLQDFALDEIRLIVRATQTYGQLLMESFHPDLLRDGLDRERFFDRLWVQASARPQLRELIPAEVADLHGGDIPLFTTRPNICDIFTSQGSCVAAFLNEPSLMAVTRRLRAFDEQDLSKQVWFIEASLATLELSSGHAAYPHQSSAVQALLPVYTGRSACTAFACCLCGRRPTL